MRTESQSQLRTLSSPLETPPQLDSRATIRLISAAPSASGVAPGPGDPFIDPSITSSPFVSVSPPTPLAPKDTQASRKRLVPKRSRLGLLVSGKRSRTPDKDDLSDVVRRVGGSTATASGAKSGFEIFVNSTAPSEVGEVLMVKKKKSRVALSGLKWGTLAEVTNSCPSRDSSKAVKLKSEDKEKWWSIGRGRKDFNEMRIIEKDSTADPSGDSEALSSRTRFHSLDSSVALSATPKTLERPAQIRSASVLESPLQDSDIHKNASYVPATSYPGPRGLTEPLPGPPDTTTGSIAIRAMRSMRSLAGLANWANGKHTEKDTTQPTPAVQKQKDKQVVVVTKNKKLEKQKSVSGRSQMTGQLFGGSSEADVPVDKNTPTSQASTARKHRVLGLGFPSGFRFGTVRSSSAGSSGQSTAGSNNAISLDSRGRSSSMVSTVSSLKPSSAKSRMSSGSASVKWVGERLETVKVACRRERVMKHQDKRSSDSKETRPVGSNVDVFPEQASRRGSSSSASSVPTLVHTAPATTVDGRFIPKGEPSPTPCRQTRVRPASDQMTAKERYGSVRHDTDGVLSALDAATNELASLISRLDLEATPSTSCATLRLSPSFPTLLAESPRMRSSPKKRCSSITLQTHPNTTFSASSGPCEQSHKRGDDPNTQRFDQQIAPWPVSPPKPPRVPPLGISHGVSSTPGGSVVAASLACESPTASLEPSFVFCLPPPAKTKKSSVSVPVAPIPPSQERFPTPASTIGVQLEPFSIKSRSVSNKKSTGLLVDSPKDFPLRKTFRKMMSTLSLSARKDADLGLGSDLTGVLMSKEARRDLGLGGTLGSSSSSRHPVLSMDLNDPYSDIPKELQVILTGGDIQRLSDLEHTLMSPPSLTRQPPSPGLPPESPLPTPVVPQTSVVPSGGPMISISRTNEMQPEDSNDSDTSSLGENDTKKSFDFTSELERLSESAGIRRRSFVEQLENAFRTPAKYDLDRFGLFGLEEDIPPMPPNPHLRDKCRMSNEPSNPNAVTSSSVSPLLPSPEIVASKKLRGAASSRDLSSKRLQKSSVLPKPSYGQLNLDFKFGGSLALSAMPVEKPQLTLSDIIPSPAHARSLSMTSVQENASPLASTASQSMNATPSSYPSAHCRVSSESSSKFSMHCDPRVDAGSLHSRTSSRSSFKGLESFDEIRRGFEFVENRPAFYPPPFNHRHNQLPRDSMISIASVSSYGVVINPGVKDPFDYGYQSRPASCDVSAFMTMSTSMDDTFSFIRRGPRRNRVDSDSSSFYFRAPGTSRIPRPLKSQLRRDSVISSTSLAPPVSIYNRSFGVHRRIDSISSVNSGPQVYATTGFRGRKRSSWAPSHRRDTSADSLMSDMSVRIPRPTLGDKMLDSRHDYCLPLTSIKASPIDRVLPNYPYETIRHRGSLDSIMDDEQQSYLRDSIMDQSSRSRTPESVFGQDEHAIHSPLTQFRYNDNRRSSLLSEEDDSADPKHEDDTMISMIGGGRIRRRSVGSFVQGSPIFVRVGKRKPSVMRGKHANIVQGSHELVESPDAAQKVERSPCGLGEERMISARKGLLSRDSLEEHCLSAEGMDTSFMAEPVFSRPAPASRARSGTLSSTSSGLDTPSLSSCGETSSVAGDSISGIDLSRISLSLGNMLSPSAMQSRTRIRSKGHGHRRRLSGIQISRASVYETIEEEHNTPVSHDFSVCVKAPLSPVNDNVIIVDPEDASTVNWDERGIVAFRQYYSLKDEADVTIKESKQLWSDTPFSIYAVQSFEPPAHRAGMRALLEHSRQTYGPLSAEYRRIRSRTSSRPSPYPQPKRAVKISLSPVVVRQEILSLLPPKPATAPALSTAQPPIFVSQPLQQHTVNPNIITAEISPLAPGKSVKCDPGLLPHSQLSSQARRSVFGRTARSAGKENQALSSGAMTAPGENLLRLNRPRPRGRPVHSRAIVPIKV
ncbi:hypothetical protein F5148DRAFT_1288750 [Russula earlei]|uniref:Uncharacterized protein n=1 Tax=Russula earlei TaxID=71964 RepID=A0ACC0TZ56_9AGAM|nr:hypothetical protein F5148DRAFT_1288750 [Russula earlei]